MSRSQKGWNRRLLLASSTGEARALLKQGAVLSAQDEEGRLAMESVLRMAAWDGDLEMMQKLARAGAFDARSAPSAYKALMRAISALSAPDERRASEGGEILAQRAEGAVWLARELGKTRSIRDIEREMELDPKGRSFNTALIAAVEKEALGVARALIEAGSDPNAPGRFGRTALMAAAYCDSSAGEIASALLEAGASPWQVDIDGNGAVDHASDEPDDVFAGVLRSWIERSDLEEALGDGKGAGAGVESLERSKPALGQARRRAAL